MDHLTFVVYYSDLPEKTIEKMKELVVSFSTPIWQDFFVNQREYINIFFQSTHLFHPNSKSVVLTDASTPLTFPPEIQVMRFPTSPELPAYSSIFAQLEYLKQADPKSHHLFFDFDMLIQSPLYDLFEKTFDLAFCYRQGKFPITGGVTIVHRNGISKAISFLEKVIKTFDDKHPEQKTWWGGQASVRDTIGVEVIENRSSDFIDVDGTKIYLLSANDYSYHPPMHVPMIDYYPDKKVLHFKGHRKKEMLYYWNNYLKPSK